MSDSIPSVSLAKTMASVRQLGSLISRSVRPVLTFRRSILSFILVAGVAAGVFAWRQTNAANNSAKFGSVSAATRNATLAPAKFSFSIFKIVNPYDTVYTISGTVNDAAGTPITSPDKSVTLLINGATPATVTTVTGVFTFSVTYVDGDVLTVYVDGDDPVKGATVTRGDTTVDGGSGSGSITNLNINQDTLTVRNEDPGPITNANLNTGNPETDTDLTAVYTVSGGVLTTPAGKSLTIFAGSTFSPGGSVVDGGNWIKNGTFSAGAFTVTMNGIANQTIGGLSNSFFNNLTVNNTGVAPNNLVSLAVDTNVAGVLSVNGGVFDQGSNLITTGSATNVVSVAAAGTWRNLGTGDLTLSGGVSNVGTIQFNANGTPCGDVALNDDILIRSSAGGTQRTWSGSGTFSMTDVDVADQKVPGGLTLPLQIVVNSGTNSGNNTGWTFVDTCTSGTYTWIGGASQDWQVPTNWTPTRVTPNAADVLVFDGASTPAPIVNNVPSETDAEVDLENGALVTLNASPVGAPQTLTLAGGGGQDRLKVPALTSLTLAGTSALQVSLTNTSTAAIGGTFIMQDGAHRLLGAAGAINFGNGSIFTTAAGFTGNPFGTATNGSVTFASGSAAFFNAGGDPFGGDGNSVAQFNQGSSQTFTVASAFSSAGRTYGHLTLSGSQSYLAAGASSITVFGNLTINSGSSLTLSPTAGGNLILLGDFTNSGGFDANGRKTLFQGGSSTEMINGSVTFFDLIVNKTGGSVKVGNSVTVSNALNFEGTTDILDIGAGDLSLNGTVGGANANGALDSTAYGANLHIGGTGAIGPVRYLGTQNLASLEVNRTSGGLVTFATGLNIGNGSSGGLVLTNGVVEMGSNTLSLATFPGITRTNGYVSGNLQKSFGATGNFTFAVGTANGYSPLDTNVTANSGGILTVKAVQGKYPKVSGTNALQRYWTLSGSGLTANLTFHYSTSAPNDVVGNEGLYQIFKYDGSFTQFTPDATGVNSPQDHFATLNNVSTFSDWTLAEAASVTPGTLQFVGAPYTDPETDTGTHTRTITVSRTGGADGALDVSYATSAGTATAGTDYVETSGALHWNDGESGNKTFDITVNGDTTYEANETVNITLSNVTDAATITPPNPTTLTITNDDPVPANATLVVNTTDDNDFGACVTAHCSLREAINAANSLPDANTINFNIPNTDPNFGGGVYVIKPTTQLPTVLTNITIDGTSQTSFGGDTNVNGPEIVLNGSLSTGAVGLLISGDGNTIKSLVVNGFGNGGILISHNNDQTPSNNQILNNYVGTDALGSAAAANTGIGVDIHGFGSPNLQAANNTVQGNVISGNTDAGLGFCDAASTTVSGNFIGTDRTGTADVHNGSHGILFQCTGDQNNTLTTNTIAFNLGDGIRDVGVLSAHFGDKFSQNSIFDNTGLGINLIPNAGVDGVTPNDAGDSDTGANGLQNFPVITSAKVTGPTKTIKGTLNSIASETFTIEFFANTACDGSGNGEGKTYLGSTPVTTDGSGNGSFTFHPATLSVGDVITATATDSGNNTSEFSACFATVAGTPGTLQFSTANTNDTELNSSTHPVTVTVTRTGGSDGDVSVHYATSDGTATSGSDYDSASGDLNWLEGDTTSKTFDVTIHGDTTYEANETINLALSNAQVAALGSPSTATITIVNDDAPAATLVVNTTDDNDFGACLVVHCSLREAINAANFTGDANTINFNIPNTDPNFGGAVYVIKPTTQLPTVLTNITIDGTSQTSFGGDTNVNGPEIVLNGSLSTGAVGLLISGDGNTIKSLVVNGFGNGGILISHNNDQTPSNNQILNNYVGTDAVGSAAVANTGIGVDIHGFGSPSSQAANNTVQGNVISGNTDAGLGFCDAAGTTVSGNFIGTDRTGTADVHNGSHGVLFQCTGDQNNTLTSNTIAFNLGDGIRDVGVLSAHFGDKFSQNSIFDNTGLGINLIPNAGVDGVTPNDAGDPDTGANGLQNFPVVNVALVGGSNTISGTLNSTPGQTFTIELYGNATCDSSGNGEGKTYLGSATTTVTDGNGDATFSFVTTAVTAGEFITATATDASGNTSEFSACFQARTFVAGTIEFAQANTNDTETDGLSHTVNITVNRTGGSDGAASVNYAVTDGTATTADNDYSVSPASGTFNWADGDSTSRTITITVKGDTKFETDETVIITLSGPTGAAISGTNPATLTIVNDDSQPTISINDVPQNEGNGPGTTNIAFTVSLSNASYLPITVDYTTAIGTTNPATVGTCGTAGADYQTVSGTVSFAPGESSNNTTVQVPVCGDTTFEANETFFVNLSNPNANATILDSQGLGTITNDDPQPTISINNVTHNEGNTHGIANDPDLTSYVFTVSLSNPSDQTITVDYATANDTAVAPSDYTAVTTTTLTFNPGETSKPVTVIVNGDTNYELTERFFVNLSNANANATILDGQGDGTITNDDAAPTLAIGDRSLNEGTTLGTSTSFNFTVTKTGSTDVNATVNFATADGTAIGNVAPCPSGGDYQTQNGSLTFLPNETTKTITVPVCKDATFEGNETFFVNLSGEANATVTDNQGQGTILNDDIPSTGFVVNTTNDTDDGVCNGVHCSLREAINAANGSSTAVAINFAIPAADPNLRHFYYANDTVAGQVSLANVTATSASDDTMIAGIDPDWPHSWWSILPTSQLPSTTKQVFIDGYSQTGATVNSLATGDNAVLRIELDGLSAGTNVTGLSIAGGTSNVRGLVINRFQRDGAAPTPTGIGLNLQSGSATATGNFIGADVSGTLDLGNGGSGISTANFNETIGGSTPDVVNLISGNDGNGITFSNSNTNVILGNLIGTKANGTAALGNSGSGISLSGLGSVANTIGGTGAGEANTIAFSGADGVSLDTASFGNSIRGNSIFSNGTTNLHLGIDLGTDGVTANDAQDPDTGPNGLQNFPVITSALVTGSTRTITGTLNSSVGDTFTIDFYQSPACDTAGNGEGKTYLGSITTGATDSNGDVAFTFHPSVLTVGQVVTATATSTGASFNTSEFSACASITDGSPGAGDIQFTSANYTVAENVAGQTVGITLTRVGGSNGSISAQFNTTNGSATAGSDYTNASQTVTFGEGETSKTINVTITDDSIYEGNETVNLSLGATSINAAQSDGELAPVADPHAAVLTITENDPAPSFTIDDVTHLEGNSGTTSYVFTVTKTGSTALNAGVSFQTQNSTATTTDNDYQTSSGTLSFLPADMTKTITVLVNGDLTVEPNEAFFVNLTTPTNATIADNQGVGTITNDDTDVSVAVSPVSVAEDGAPNLVYTFTRTGVTTGALTVNFSVGGGAAFATDYTQTGAASFTASSGTVTFGAGNSTATVTVDPTSDTTVEGDETVILTVTSGTGYNVASPSSATGTITNDDTDVTIAVSPASVAEDGAGNLVYTFTRTGVTSTGLTVNFSVGGGAAFGTDYTQTGAASFTATTGTVTFGAGNSTATVTVDPASDTTVEGDETVILTVTSGAGYNVVSPSAATGTITNDDTDVTVGVSPASVGEDGVANLVYTFSRTGVTSNALTVNFSVGGTATFATDYTQTGATTFGAASGTVTFTAGNSNATVTIDPTPDISFEANETVILTVTSGTGYSAGSPSAATGTINNDDAAGGIIQFTANNYATTENSRKVTITVERLGDTSGAVTVNYATPDDSEATSVTPCSVNSSGFASPRCDFTTGLGTIRFADGDNTPKTFDILISQDSYVEPPENLTITLSNLTGSAVFGVNSTATVTIADDDLTAPTTNPIDDASNFVRQHYHDFLNREPDQSGFDFWTNEITSCGTNQQCIDFKRVQVSAAFYLSIEFQDTGYLVERLYKSSYGDQNGSSTFGGAHQLAVPVVRFSEFLGDTQEIGQGVVVGAAGWPQALENNKAAFADRFVQRARFVAAFPLSMTPAQFVDKLNLNAGNPLSQAERDQLVADLTSSAKTRAQVLRAVAEDQDLKNAEFNRAFVLMQYFGYLRRNANVAPDSDYSGYDFWLTKLNQFNGNFQNADMVKAFITSSEYRGRSGP